MACANMQGNKKKLFGRRTESTCERALGWFQACKLYVCALKAEVLEFKDFIFTPSFTEPGTRTLGQN